MAREQDFLKEKFREYYSRVCPVPSDLSRREFGAGWVDKIDYRHKAFKDERELRQFLVTEVPLFISYSSAHYEFPDARPMPNKRLLGADLVFDLDAPSQKEEHAHNELLCLHCLEQIKQDALRLKEEFLEGDFGFSSSEVAANFSGQKGFHLHVVGAAVQDLSQDARKQLVGHIAGPAAGSFLVAYKETAWGESDAGAVSKDSVLRGPSETDKGWKGKAFQAAFKAVRSAPDSLEGLRFRKSKIEEIISRRDFILERLKEGNWDAVKGLERLWTHVLAGVRGLAVDQAVTFDTSRLMRLPDSLHGSTGFAAKKLARLDSFGVDDAIVFSKDKVVEVIPREDVSFELAGRSWDLKRARFVEVPECVAVFLLCKNKVLLA